LVQGGGQAIADRYTYLPSIGIGIMLAWGIPLFFKREKIRKIILFPAGVTALVILAFLTWQQCGYWKNSVELFNHALQVTKNNPLAHVNLGIALAAEGKHQEAIDHYRNAIKINPSDYKAYCNLAVAFKDQGNIEEAVKNFRETIRINPNYEDAYYNLANLFRDQGNIEEAAKYYRETIRINPKDVDAHNNLGIILGMYYKKNDEAIYQFRQSLQIDKNNSDTHVNIAIALANKGELKEAIEHFRTAIYLKPDDAQARQALKEVIELEQNQKKIK